MSQTATSWVGIDWGHSKHYVCILDADGKQLASFEVPHSNAGLSQLVGKLQETGAIAGVAVETSRGPLILKLLHAGFTVYIVNPKQSAEWRKACSVGEAKSDRTDSRCLAQGLRLYHEGLRELSPDDPLTRELAMLCEDECKLIRQQTALVLRLQATLKEYYPEAPAWFDDWASATSWDFVLTFPDAASLHAARKSKLIRFLKAHHIGLSPTWQQRLDTARTPSGWPSDEAVVRAKSLLAISTARELRTNADCLRHYRKRIEELYAGHPDAPIFSSLPGVAGKLGPRLLSHFGADRRRYESAASLQQLSGVVPVPRSSGNRQRAVMRRGCQRDFRNTMFLFACCSMKRCGWARAVYDQAKAAGKTHGQAARKVGEKWLRIIYGMWLHRVPYDESIYLTSLIRRRSPLVADARSWTGGA